MQQQQSRLHLPLLLQKQQNKQAGVELQQQMPAGLPLQELSSVHCPTQLQQQLSSLPQ
jgi:hypothetical protein